ncbi:hypothetical protein TcasGA2_TC012810 [Tribolium castaneum]|uniref:Uncharacterized protein n=1 Tax=Tribolium castaneum TaxID=7070 RepID=D6X0T8_TRICA|nr:PREDICTED: uncharacterized protein LOC103314361 isoform X1 [Tribolium castaneum]XP_015839142.1 PREDICTED: uncharacterized protein LOC103314361 isoform X1 [Tribolium castaneum]EFA10554.2 hypothetical protein TcasGA2_TC012810 [Tribolium castaneum]|eukprot:XP_015839141.1 PREDICTED: uncharacterized protein LOC103314361 isoform X1 [Tribolium castaneum]
MSNFTVFFLSLLTLTCANPSFNVFKKVYMQCSHKSDIFKCLKIQGLKVVDRALHSKTFNVINGVTLVSDKQNFSKPLNESKLEQLKSEEVDELLIDTTRRFLDSHKFVIKLPKLVEEGRKKGNKGGGGGGGALLGALAIKGTFLAMAYQGIAVMSGTAIIVGKMALILSAILGLKKLVSSGQEKTTLEIVKIPKHSEVHTHSTSYEEDDHYHRSYDVFGRRIEYPKNYKHFNVAIN